jgi:hypothetical protein
MELLHGIDRNKAPFGVGGTGFPTNFPGGLFEPILCQAREFSILNLVSE